MQALNCAGCCLHKHTYIFIIHTILQKSTPGGEKDEIV